MKNKFKFFGMLLLGGLIFASLAITSCKKDDPDPDDGKINPSTIAASNLVAYFSFEGNGNDEISAMTPSNSSTTTTTFVEGRRGKAFQGAT
ncbi:MAG TPA: hypothetical protein DG754_11925, partial [Bacteroidales bacterium]|nr:hypothetical protein [Bacteroidales bacterium]